MPGHLPHSLDTNASAFPENQSSSARVRTVKGALGHINLQGWICEPCTNRANGGKMPTKEEIDTIEVEVITCASRSGVRVQYCRGNMNGYTPLESLISLITSNKTNIDQTQMVSVNPHTITICVMHI